MSNLFSLGFKGSIKLLKDAFRRKNSKLKVINLRQDGEACVSVGPSIVENVHGCKKAGWRVSYSICSKNFAMIKVALASSIFAYKNGYGKFRLRRNCCGNDMHLQFRNHVNLCLKH